MFEENIELARRAFAAISTRDLDAFLELMDPKVIVVPRILAVEGGELSGHGGVRRWWDSIFGVFPDFDIEVIGIRAGRDWTISEAHARGRGETSGSGFEDAIWVASSIRGGKVIRWQTFESEAEAVEATESGN